MIVVEHRERLGGMNTELVEASLAATGRRVVVVDDIEIDVDLLRDITEVLAAAAQAPETPPGVPRCLNVEPAS